MKVMGEVQVFQPKTVVFETKEEWQIFLSLIGSPSMYSASVSMDTSISQSRVGQIVEDMMTYQQWESFRKEVQ